jgi:hypothetical protein
LEVDVAEVVKEDVEMVKEAVGAEEAVEEGEDVEEDLEEERIKMILHLGSQLPSWVAW